MSVADAGCRVPYAGCRWPVLDADASCRVPGAGVPVAASMPVPDADTGCRCQDRMPVPVVPDAGCRWPGAGGCRMPGAECRSRDPVPVAGAGCRLPDAGCRCRMPDAGKQKRYIMKLSGRHRFWRILSSVQNTLTSPMQLQSRPGKPKLLTLQLFLVAQILSLFQHIFL